MDILLLLGILPAGYLLPYDPQQMRINPINGRFRLQNAVLANLLFGKLCTRLKIHQSLSLGARKVH